MTVVYDDLEEAEEKEEEEEVVVVVVVVLLWFLWVGRVHVVVCLPHVYDKLLCEGQGTGPFVSDRGTCCRGLREGEGDGDRRATDVCG